MKSRVTIFSIFGLAILISGCPKPCIQANYTFAATTKISPSVDSIRVGDTIIVSSSFPKALTDSRTGDLVNYNNSTGIGSTLGVVKLVNQPISTERATGSFTAVEFMGKIYKDETASPDKIYQLRYKESDSGYDLKVGLIAKDTGVFYFGVGNGLSQNIKSSKSCERASFDITLQDTDQHLYYFSQWNSERTLSEFEKARAYFIKVVL